MTTSEKKIKKIGKVATDSPNDDSDSPKKK
jgi:hypothetical protein